MERFPAEIEGELLVCRECLIDGPLKGRNLTDFFAERMLFLEEFYGDPEQFYLNEVVPQFDAMQEIPKGSNVYFWFEADLFCQLNFWFSASLMNIANGSKYYLVIPDAPNQYGFSGLDNKQLIAAHEDPRPLSSMTMAVLQQIWKACQTSDQPTALSLANMLQISVPQLAELPKVLKNYYDEQHLRLLEQIIAAQETPDFGTTFQEFCKTAPQYGFGDLQLKRLFDQILAAR